MIPKVENFGSVLSLHQQSFTMAETPQPSRLGRLLRGLNSGLGVITGSTEEEEAFQDAQEGDESISNSNSNLNANGDSNERIGDNIAEFSLDTE